MRLLFLPRDITFCSFVIIQHIIIDESTKTRETISMNLHIFLKHVV